MDTEDKIIKYVALYLRKSRGESEKDLVKHESELVRLCEENRWKYIEYKEIQSGDSIAMRPVMQSLLSDVESELFDAVCVVDIDRLGRGDLGDQDRIKKAFLNSNTLVVTPQYVYDLANENDEFSVDMRSFIARMEYKQIVKRLVKGKKIGARLGQWTNGTPPYPYEYERWKDKYNPKGLVVNDDKLKVYRYIVDSYLSGGLSTSQIAYELNKKQIPSPRNKKWTNITTYRLLTDETHLGNIISNKSVGDGHKKKKPTSKKLKKVSQDQWVVVNNCHEAVKTVEEHEQILFKLKTNNKYFPRKEIKKVYPLTGLIKCGLCGHTMQIVYREDRKSKEVVKPCWYKNSIGEKCHNHGGNIDSIYPVIWDAVNKRIDQLKLEADSQAPSSSESDIRNEIAIVEKQIKDKTGIINFIYDQYEQGIYNRQRFDERRAKAEEELSALKNQIDVLQSKLKKILNESASDKLDVLLRINELVMSSRISPEDLNKLYRSIIKSITYTRLSLNENPHIEIEFK